MHPPGISESAQTDKVQYEGLPQCDQGHQQQCCQYGGTQHLAPIGARQAAAAVPWTSDIQLHYKRSGNCYALLCGIGTTDQLPGDGQVYVVRKGELGSRVCPTQSNVKSNRKIKRARRWAIAVRPELPFLAPVLHFCKRWCCDACLLQWFHRHSLSILS